MEFPTEFTKSIFSGVLFPCSAVYMVLQVYLSCVEDQNLFHCRIPSILWSCFFSPRQWDSQWSDWRWENDYYYGWWGAGWQTCCLWGAEVPGWNLPNSSRHTVSRLSQDTLKISEMSSVVPIPTISQSFKKYSLFIPLQMLCRSHAIAGEWDYYYGRWKDWSSADDGKADSCISPKLTKKLANWGSAAHPTCKCHSRYSLGVPTWPVMS